MNVFPSRKEGADIFYKEYHKDYINNLHIKNNNTVVAFPDARNLNKQNDILMKNFLDV